MITAEALGPQISYEDGKKSLDWNAFGQGVLKNNHPEIDKVTEVVYDIVSSINNEYYSAKVFKKRSQEHLELLCGKRAHEFEGFVTHLDISHHFLDYVRREIGESTNKLLWNSLNNILRVLKRKRNNEPLYLLPKEDLKLTRGFLEKLSQPPRKDYY